MNIGRGILVFFGALIALVAEIVLYFFLGMGAVFSEGGTEAVGSLAFFFIGLMIFTCAVGVFYPICSVLAVLTKNKSLGQNLFLIILALVVICYAFMASENNKDNKPNSSVTSPILNGTPSNSVSSPPTASTLSQPAPIVEKPTESPEEIYIKNSLVLKDVSIIDGYGKYDTPGYSKSRKALKGNIKNIGDKTIGYLKIVVYFLDSGGLRVGEQVIPVLNTENIMEQSVPLKPNYSKDLGFIVEEDAPSDWAGKVEVEINTIRFIEPTPK